jgi:hypothetical protein
VVAKLDIADYLLLGEKSTTELAELANVNEESLYRVMRLRRLYKFKRGLPTDYTFS